MKRCNVSGCSNRVFSHGKCKYHLYKLPSYQKKLNKTSDKRKEYEKVYKRVTRQIDAASIRDTGCIQCFFCSCPVMGVVDHHHVAGKQGISDNGIDLYLDPQGIVPCHPGCHRPEQNGYHSLSLQEIQQQRYFRKLLEKIKSVSIRKYTDWCIKLNINLDEPITDCLSGEY